MAFTDLISLVTRSISGYYNRLKMRSGLAIRLKFTRARFLI